MHGIKLYAAAMAAAVAGVSCSSMQSTPPGPSVNAGSVTVTGRVTNSAGAAIGNARVYVPGTGEATRTDANGYYSLTGVPGGPQVVVVRRYGYSPVRTDVKFSTKPSDAERNRIDVTLPTPGEAVAEATLRRSDSVGLANTGFFGRQSAIRDAYFITPQQIDDMNPRTVSDLFRGVPVLTESPGAYGTVLRGVQGCLLAYVDGLPWRSMFAGDLDTDIPIRDVVAAEVSPPGRAPPAPFVRGRPRQNCTTVGIWTRSAMG